MMSGRGLGHTGGTVDKLESMPGFRTDLDLGEFRDVLADVGCAMIRQTPAIAPLDGRLYALRDVTGTVPSLPLIVGSIMSKKLAAGPETIVIDLKTGSGAFMNDIDRARELASSLVAVRMSTLAVMAGRSAGSGSSRVTAASGASDRAQRPTAGTCSSSATTPSRCRTGCGPTSC